jgi:hypothetical protein
MMLCVIGFELVMVESLTDKIFPAVFGLAAIIQLSIYAFGGQLIIDKSDAVARNFYDVDRDFLILIARPLKPTKIKTLFFSADLPTFVSILNSAGSLITMLKSLVK